MDMFQFALFFAAVVIGFVLVFLRTARTAPLLEELGRLRSVDDRLKAIEASLLALRGQLNTTVLQDALEVLRGIHERLGQLGETAAAPKVVEIPVPVRTEARAVDSVRTLVENRLFGMGYRQVKILSDLPEQAGPEELQVLVECQRDDVACKGHLLLKNGAVLDVRLHSVLQMFP